MKLVFDPEALEWLGVLQGRSSDFEWDAGNRDKNRKHDVGVHDIESMGIVEPHHDESRWLILGQNARGRKLALVFTRRGDRIRPISCRPMRRKEWWLYEQAARA